MSRGQLKVSAMLSGNSDVRQMARRTVVILVVYLSCLAAASPLTFAASPTDPPVIGRLCTAEMIQIQSSDDFEKLLGQIQSFLILAPHLPDYPNKCLLSLPGRVWQIIGPIDYSEWKKGNYRKLTAISTIAWYYASYSMHPAASPLQATDDRETAFTKALSESYSDDIPGRDCILNQYEFAKLYVQHLLGKSDQSQALNVFRRFASGTNAVGCRLPFFTDKEAPPLFTAATAWGRELELEDFAARSSSDKTFLTQLYFGLLGSSKDDKKRFIQHEMLSDPLLIPGALTPGGSAPLQVTTNVHLGGSLTAGDAPVISLDKNLGASVVDRKETNDWYNREYGEVYSQSDLYVLSAGTVATGPAPESVVKTHRKSDFPLI